ncbi:MAG: ubiquinone/menaquinone biosynthesis C-methyltransferase UbiE [Rhodomicrobium sp.]|nr:MAG: ubiquinone/menaquinone biosynthesis C-methyltransferase UbiE [Rhodomicrobium sp.]
MTDNTSSYGFQQVDPSEKQSKVNHVFARVARDYDLMNDLMSGGMHRLWKNELITTLNPRKTGPLTHLDVAGGTGDITFRLLDRASPDATATILDISREMLEVGKDRASETRHKDRIDFVEGNAESLPLENISFDSYTIAFGIRNVPRIDAALKEAYRVLKPGGRFLCLEFSEVQMPILDSIYDKFSFNMIPKMGEMVMGDGEPYKYLVESIRRFPDQETFKSMISNAGFAQVSYRNLTGGIAAIHSGWRI